MHELLYFLVYIFNILNSTMLTLFISLFEKKNKVLLNDICINEFKTRTKNHESGTDHEILFNNKGILLKKFIS